MFQVSHLGSLPQQRPILVSSLCGVPLHSLQRMWRDAAGKELRPHSLTARLFTARFTASFLFATLSAGDVAGRGGQGAAVAHQTGSGLAGDPVVSDSCGCCLWMWPGGAGATLHNQAAPDLLPCTHRHLSATLFFHCYIKGTTHWMSVTCDACRSPDPHAATSRAARRRCARRRAGSAWTPTKTLGASGGCDHNNESHSSVAETGPRAHSPVAAMNVEFCRFLTPRRVAPTAVYDMHVLCPAPSLQRAQL